MKKKKMITMGMLVLALTTGCTGGKKNAEEEGETERGTEAVVIQGGHLEESTENMLNEFYALLQLTKDSEEAYAFVEKHVETAKTKDADQLINGLIGYFADIDAPDYTRISELKNNLSEEMQCFIDLMEAEQNSPAIVDNQIQVSLSELLNRGLQFEEQAVKYPDGITYPYAYEKYSELLQAAVTGLYDGTNIWSNCYLDTDQIHIEQEAIDEYGTFVRVHSESNMAIILQDYLQILNENEEEFNQKVQRFDQELPELMHQKFRIME